MLLINQKIAKKRTAIKSKMKDKKVRKGKLENEERKLRAIHTYEHNIQDKGSTSVTTVDLCNVTVSTLIL